MEENKKLKCCFCGEELNDIGNSPYPFFRFHNGMAGCCDICNAYTTPFRKLLTSVSLSQNEIDEIGTDIRCNLEWLKKTKNTSKRKASK